MDKDTEDTIRGAFVDVTENPVEEHIFRCPKCGMTSDNQVEGLMVRLKTKLHLECVRCGWKWIEDTLDKRE